MKIQKMQKKIAALISHFCRTSSEKEDFSKKRG